MCDMPPSQVCEGSDDAEKCAADLIWPPNCECPASCQPRPVCPDIRVPMPICQDGQRPQPIYDDNGCLVGYECQPVPCQTVPKPQCDGALMPIYEDGCVVGYECEPATACDELQKEYKATLQKAKSCGLYAGVTAVEDNTTKDSDMLPREECTTTVSSNLGCMACPTFVNPANARAIARLTEIQRLWSRSCMRDMMCPAMACLAPEGASCVDGLCQDNPVLP